MTDHLNPARDSRPAPHKAIPYQPPLLRRERGARTGQVSKPALECKCTRPKQKRAAARTRAPQLLTGGAHSSGPGARARRKRKAAAERGQSGPAKRLAGDKDRGVGARAYRGAAEEMRAEPTRFLRLPARSLFPARSSPRAVRRRGYIGALTALPPAFFAERFGRFSEVLFRDKPRSVAPVRCGTFKNRLGTGAG